MVDELRLSENIWPNNGIPMLDRPTRLSSTLGKNRLPLQSTRTREPLALSS